MNFRIADTFTHSLGKLSGNEQKAVKTTAFDLQLNPARPGLRMHRLDGARDPNFWSIRVSRDIRMILHRTRSSLLLCYVDHHDNAYHWAERRKIETHPKTGAAQLVEVRERIKEIVVPVYVEEEQEAPPKPLPFAEISDEELLSYGVPPEWVDDVHNADQNKLIKLVDHLPEEASEVLLELADGGTPSLAKAVAEELTDYGEKEETSPPSEAVSLPDPFEHPDAQRRFFEVTNKEELERALEYPWEKWALFLHPSQSAIVEKGYGGPFRVSGTAGTGKTVVAIHRAVFLARNNSDSRVLLTTFSDTLADALRAKVRRLTFNEPRLAERLEVASINAVGERLYRAQFGPPKIATQEQVQKILGNAAKQVETHKFSLRFLLVEWEDVVDAWQLDTWEAYRDVRRLGRKTRLPEEQRMVLWEIFERVRAELRNRGLVTRAGMLSALAEKLKDRRNPPFDFAIVDEAQDVDVAQLRFLAALGGDRPNSLFFAGDLGQRIFQTPFSWKALGVDIRGRSQTLKLNYRTSHQIRKRSDRLLGTKIADVDGNVQDRRGTVSAFNGEPPAIHLFETEKEEIDAVGIWLLECLDQGVGASEIGVFVRSANELDRARAAVRAAELNLQILDESDKTDDDCVSISTMHLAKGLEFRAVAVMACDDEVIPSQERIESVADASDLEDVYNTERHLLYVACTRARDHLTVSGVTPSSEFLDDLRM